MKRFYLQHPIPVLTKTATSFPAGIIEAYKALYKTVPAGDNRTSYGISSPDNGTIIYKAAITKHNSDKAEELQLQEFEIPANAYISLEVENFRSKETLVKEAFEKLLAHPQIDKNGFCLEIYRNENDVTCLIPLSSRINIHDELPLKISSKLHSLRALLDRFTDESINRRNACDSWCARQVIDHLLKSYNITDLCSERVFTKRDPAANIAAIKSIFLDFTKKYSSPAFIQPDNATETIEDLHFRLDEAHYFIMKYLHEVDLSETCMQREFPGLGYLTGYEWMHLILYHTQRHLVQLDKIYYLIQD